MTRRSHPNLVPRLQTQIYQLPNLLAVEVVASLLPQSLPLPNPRALEKLNLKLLIEERQNFTAPQLKMSSKD